MIVRKGKVLSVEHKHMTYVIEPIRYQLGFTRTEMIDEHLRGRGNDPVWRDHVDALLDARRVIESIST